MLLHVPAVLDATELSRCRDLLAAADWADGRITAGTQSAREKRNLQLPESAPQLSELRTIVESALARHGLFFSAALPARIYPPLFNRYEGGMDFGDHIDNAMRQLPQGGWLRTDLSATLFLCEPDDYDGGELRIDDRFAEHWVKLPAGDLVLYPATTVHRVEPVTRGVRLASFFWIQSLVRDVGERALLFDMDLALSRLRGELGERQELVELTGVYHNLLRRWGGPH
ncbi:Fe2+-dependent dioxygenase [Chitinimonas lacunae]|uniref:Fe2+-dependent dioxygenase n=1 Tax=Chitinimonas lacunae TaxID=1963018 RepID=A0ABV8MWR8_9NEIS